MDIEPSPGQVVLGHARKELNARRESHTRSSISQWSPLQFLLKSDPRSDFAQGFTVMWKCKPK